MADEKTAFDFIDYREFLKECYERLKKKDKKYSQRYFMQKLGVKSTAFFAEILNSKRNLNHQNVLSFVKILKLDHDEAFYFENLVNFNQSRSEPDKRYWLQKMMESSKVNPKILNPDLYEYFSKWYMAAIRELLFYHRQAVNPGEIAVKLNPAITADQAEGALRLLEKLALIEKLADGSFRQKDTLIATGDLIRSIEIANYQLQTLDLAKHALDSIPVTQRDISTLTMSVSKEAFAKITDIIKKAKQDVLKVAQGDSHEDRVYQFNIQFFPLTKIDT
jgi:uncharacterized protein (TIGR02147 family)